MNKRVLIFAPEIKDRQEISVFINNYFKNNFKGSELEIQDYFRFNEPPEINRLGHWGEEGEGEVLVIIDQRLSESNSRFKNMRNNSYYEKSPEYHAFDLSKKLCDEKDIPYLIYRGELVKNEESLLTKEIDDVKYKIKSRLESKIIH